MAEPTTDERTAPTPQGPPTGPALPDRVTLPLLTLITQQSLDEDYQHAARRRSREGHLNPRRQRHQTVAVVIAVFGALVATAAVQTSRDASIDDASRNTLISRITDRREAVSTLQDDIVTLRELNVALESNLQRIATEATAADNRLRRLQTAAGFVRVQGPGVRVSIESAPGADVLSEVRDEDLALLVNGLWSAGSEAIAINGQRLTALGAIRNSGPSSIRVNRIAISPPFTVLAIGDTRTLQANLAATTSGQAFAQLELEYGFRVQTDNVDELTLPAARVRTLRHAEPIDPDDDDNPRTTPSPTQEDPQ